MIEQILTLSLSSITSLVDTGPMPPEAVSISSLFSGVGALILGKFTGSIGGLTMPINYSALFLGAMASNWLLHGIDLPIDKSLQQPMLVTMIGMVFAAFVMMRWLNNEHASR